MADLILSVADATASSETPVVFPPQTLPWSTSILDNFNRANQGPPPSGSWIASAFENNPVGLSVVNNQLATDSSQYSSNVWVQKYTGGPQEVFLTISGINQFLDLLLFACVQQSGVDTVTIARPASYFIEVQFDTLFLGKMDGSNASNLIPAITDPLRAAQGGTNIVVGDTVGLRVDAGVVSVWLKRASTGSWVMMGGALDSTYTSGYLAVVSSGGSQFDNFGGGIGLSVSVADTTTTSEAVRAPFPSPVKALDTLFVNEFRIGVTRLNYKFVGTLENVRTTDGASVVILIGTTDKGIANLESNAKVADTTATSEATTAGLNPLLAAATDTTITSEFVASPFPTGVAPVDTTTTSEAAFAALGTDTISVADSAATTDSCSAQCPGPVVAAETIGSADVPAVILSFITIGVEDDTVTSELVAAPFPGPVVATETAITSEFANAFRVNQTDLSLAVTEAVTTTDASTERGILFVFASDATTLPAGGGSLIAVTDKTVTSEAVTVTCPGPVSVLDVTVTSEAFNVKQSGTLAIVVAETSTVSEFVAVGARVVQAAEAVTTSETLLVATPPVITFTLEVAATEATTTSEFIRAVKVAQFQIFVQEVTTADEWFVVATPPVITFTYELAVADATVTSEAKAAAPQPAAALNASAADRTSLSELLAFFWPTYDLATAEATSVRDAVATGGTVFDSESDSATTAENVAVNLESLVTVSETTTTSEALANTQAFNEVAAEATSVSEVPLLQVLVNLTEEDDTVTSEFIGLFLLGGFQIGIAEDTPTSETVGVSLVPALAVADVTTSAENLVIGIANIVVKTESVATTDAPSLASLSSVSVEDDTATSEFVSTGRDLIARASDATVTTEVLVEQLTIAAKVAEAALSAEAVAATEALVFSVADVNIGTSDSTQEIDLPGFVSVQDNFGPTTDSATTKLSVTISVSDSTTTSEARRVSPEMSTTSREVASVAETLGMFEVIGKVTVADNTTVSEFVTFASEISVSDHVTASSEFAAASQVHGFQLAVSDSTLTSERVRFKLLSRWKQEWPAEVTPQQREGLVTDVIP